MPPGLPPFPVCEYIIYPSLFFKSRIEYVSFGSHHKGAIWLVRVKGSPPGQNRNPSNKGRRRHILLTVVRHAEPPWDLSGCQSSMCANQSISRVRQWKQ